MPENDAPEIEEMDQDAESDFGFCCQCDEEFHIEALEHSDDGLICELCADSLGYERPWDPVTGRHEPILYRRGSLLRVQCRMERNSLIRFVINSPSNAALLAVCHLCHEIHLRVNLRLIESTPLRPPQPTCLTCALELPVMTGGSFLECAQLQMPAGNPFPRPPQAPREQAAPTPSVLEYSAKAERLVKWSKAAVVPSSNGGKPRIHCDLLLGVELEAMHSEKSDLTAHDLLCRIFDRLKGFAIVCRDGSLSHCSRTAFEIKTIPAPLRLHRAAWKPFFRDCAPHLAGFTVRECGMHVHLDRSKFESRWHISKFHKFVNSASNDAFIKHIAGRDLDNSWCDQYCFKKDKSLSDYLADPPVNHHAATNEAGSVGDYMRNTLEVRIFQSNVSALGFFKNLEFTAALHDYTSRAGPGDLGYQEFITWLRAEPNCSRYKALFRWLRKKNRFLKAGSCRSNLEETPENALEDC